MQFQLIPYAEDTEELKRYASGDPAARAIAREAQARWSALPNVHFAVSNDREIVFDGDMSGREIQAGIIDEIASDMSRREPWGTMLTNHQSRGAGYAFVDAPWSDIVTLEDLDQVDGEIILTYRSRGNDPVVNDEDRYEEWRNPVDDRYFFRRLMWATLLSGGHATYGGLRTYEAYDGSPIRGVRGYFDANRSGALAQGAHDFRFIHQFFDETELTLVNFIPDDAACGDQPLRWKCAHRGDTFIAYLANPTGSDPGTDSPAREAPQIRLELPEGQYRVRWFDPGSGDWHAGETLRGGSASVTAPDIRPNASADWVLLLEKG